jgi:hypothetical protein
MAVLLAAAILVLAGCQQSATGAPSATPPQSLPPGGSPVKSADPASSTSDGAVLLEVDVVGSGARITIANRTDGSVAGLDQRSQCSVLVLEVEIEGAWGPTPSCPSGPPPTDIPIATGASLTVDLTLEPGTYRVRFPYSPGERFDPAAATEAVSDPFTVG